MDDFLAHFENAQEKDREAGPKDEPERLAPGGVAGEDDRIDQVGSDAEARGEDGGKMAYDGEKEGRNDERADRRGEGGSEFDPPFA